MATGTLTGQTIANTYKALLKITGTTAGGETLHATTQKVIEDGDGNPFPFSAAQDAILMTGTSRLEFNDNGEYISGDGTNLTITSGADIILAGTAVNITADTIDLSDATKDVTLNAAVDALNFDSNTLSIDATNNRIGIGTAAPATNLHIYSVADNAPHLLLENYQNADTDDAAVIELYLNDQTTGGIGDNTDVGVIRFTGDEKDGGTKETYVEIRGVAVDPGQSTSNKGGLSFFVQTAGDLAETLTLNESNVGIGTSSPTSILNVSVDGQPQVNIDSYDNTDGNQAYINITKAAGTEASPQNVADDEALGQIQWKGYNTGSGGGYDIGASIACAVDGTPGDGDLPSRLVFSTTADGAGAPTARMTILQSGNVGIGEVAPETQVEISGTAPYLTLHNTTEEDADGGRESKIFFKGERANATETTLGQIYAMQQGSENDYNALIRFSVNTHSVDADSLTPLLDLDSNSNVNVMSGNLVITTAGKGITFSATNTPAQSAGSGTSNTLDDYEEGTWTPTMTSGSGSVTVASVTAATYTKIGRLVYVRGRIDFGTDSSVGTSTITFAGLPFTNKNDGGYSGARLTINNQNTDHTYDGNMYGDPNALTITNANRSTSMSSLSSAWFAIDMTYVT